MAAGGSLLADGADSFVCTPLAMHGGCAPPLVVGAGGEMTLELHPGHSGFYVDVDGSAVETDARQFAVTREHPYATLVDLGDARTSLPSLRARGLIADSPRVLGQHRQAARIASQADA
jgi:hypothetical protein